MRVKFLRLIGEQMTVNGQLVFATIDSDRKKAYCIFVRLFILPISFNQRGRNGFDGGKET